MFKTGDNKNYALDARNLYVAFAERHELKFREETNECDDRIVIVPKQSKLNFEIYLTLAGHDEANVGIGEFWSYIFPFPDMVDYLNNILDGLVSGANRLVEYEQFGRVTKRQIENEINESLYTQLVRLKIPFIPEKIKKIAVNSTELEKI